MIKRIALLATTLALLGSVAMATIASGRGSRRQHAAARTQVASGAPDQVIQWNQELQTVLLAPVAQPATIHPTRTLAITQLAVYGAVNGILGGGRPLVVDLHGPRAASAAAAAAAAARTALDLLAPSQEPAIDAFFQSSLSQIGSGPRVERGLRFGDQVANLVVALRTDDRSTDTPPGFTPSAGPGEYQVTPPAFAPAAFTQTARVTPLIISTASAFRPPPPPALTSGEYAADWSEVHSLGELNSSTRTPAQTAIGKFWGAAPIWIVWNEIADQAGVAFGDSLEQNARLFALLDTTLADSAVALYDAKYTYHRWRPITAITAPDQGNGVTTTDPNWVPLANTANDPSYPGAHATFSSAAASTLADFFGTDTLAFSVSNATVGITRSFTRFSQAADEAAASRIFAGQHFRYDEEAGQALGREVARYVDRHALLPTGDHSRKR